MLSFPARFFSHCFGSHGRTLNYFRDRLHTAKRYVTWLVSNHDRSNHDRRIMSENPGVYIAMKSAVNDLELLVFYMWLVLLRHWGACLSIIKVAFWPDAKYPKRYKIEFKEKKGASCRGSIYRARISSQDSTQESTVFRFPAIFTSCKSREH